MAKFDKIKEGNVFSEVQFYVVEKIKGDKAQLRNDHGENIVIDKNYAEKCLISADQYDEEKTITKTEAANILLGSPNTAITVNFNKQVKQADVEKEIIEAYEGSTPKSFATAVKKAVKKGLEGEERTIIGRHFGELNDLGRLNFIDMEIKKTEGAAYDSRVRQVDPRQINWMIVLGKKYNIK